MWLRSVPLPPGRARPGNDAGARVMHEVPPTMNARINRLLDELDALRRAASSPVPSPERDAAVERIAAIEAELERANYQFHCVAVRG